MSTPIRRELDLARMASRERRLRLVMQILSARQGENQRVGAPTPAGLRQSIADFGEQLRDVHRRQAELGGRPSPALEEPPSARGRTDRFARSRFTGRTGRFAPDAGERT